MQPIASISTAAPTYRSDDVSFACERCKTESVLAPSKRGLGRVGELHARLLSLGRAARPHGDDRSTLAEVRAELIARAEEHEHEVFTARFRFCHECRRFVCPRCWNRSWRTCKSCVARAIAAMSPARKRFRFGLSMTVAVASLLLLAVGVGSVVAFSAARSTPPNAVNPAGSTPPPATAPAGTPTAARTAVLISPAYLFVSNVEVDAG
ncbi:MAG: hypothetical protein ACHQ01_10280 [Candidatus Limnocylindrales bacterium]